MKTKAQLEFQQTWRGSLSDYVTAIAWSTDGRFLAACSAAGEVVLISLPGFQSTLLQGETGYSVDCLAFLITNAPKSGVWQTISPYAPGSSKCSTTA